MSIAQIARFSAAYASFAKLEPVSSRGTSRVGPGRALPSGIPYGIWYTRGLQPVFSDRRGLFVPLCRGDAFQVSSRYSSAAPIWRGGGDNTIRSPSKRTPRTWSEPMRDGSEAPSTWVTRRSPSKV